MNAKAASRALNDSETTASRAWIAAHAPALVTAVALIVFALAYAMDWRLPGLYMDAVNPEYIIPGIFDPKAPGHHPWILPGNVILGRFPLFTGQIYHGSTQIYFALPLMALFGIDVGTLRIAQGTAGCVIVLLLALFLRRRDAPAQSAIATAALLLLALDPSFVVALRTQAYSCLFPLMLLLGAMLLLRGWQTKAAPRGADFRQRRPVRPRGLQLLHLRVLLSGARLVFPDRARDEVIARLALHRALARRLRHRLFSADRRLVPGRQALGGFVPMLHWLHAHSDSLHPLGAGGGALDHLSSMFIATRGVVTGRWPWIMVLQHHSGDFRLDEGGAARRRAVVTLVIARATPRAERRALVTPLVFVGSFLACATIFGSRLDGHHYTAILPFIYAAFGAACAALWTRPSLCLAAGHARAARGRPRVAGRRRRDQRIQPRAFPSRPRSERRRRLLLGRDRPLLAPSGEGRSGCDRVFPDWGYVMPFVFVSRAGSRSATASIPIASRARAAPASRRSSSSPARTTPRSSTSSPRSRISPARDHDLDAPRRRPVFQSARYAPRSIAATSPNWRSVRAVGRHRTRDRRRTGGRSDCGFLSPFSATARWDAGNPALAYVEAWIAAPGGKAKPWTGGEERSEYSTTQWAVPGMAFALVDPVTQATLARTEIARIACPAH